MKKLTLATLIASTLLVTACSQQPDTTVQTQITEPAKAKLGSFGIDLSARDESVKPGDDFFMYASGTWYKNYQMPADKTRFGAFSQLAEESEAQVKTIIDEIVSMENPQGVEKLIADYYHSYMDVETINAKGIAPIQSSLDKIASVTNQDELVHLFGAGGFEGISSPIWGGLSLNRLNPDAYQYVIGTGGLGLPDRDYYLEESERFATIRQQYLTNITKMLQFAGYSEAQAAEKASHILALETAIAKTTWPREKKRNSDLTLNQMTRAEFVAAYPGINWDLYFTPQGFKVTNLNVYYPQPLTDMIDLIQHTDIQTWKDYLTYHTISDHAGVLSEDIYLTSFEFYGQQLSGQQAPRPRWKRALSAMSGTSSLGFAIGKAYTARYFPESSKQMMAELVENLRTALRERVQNLDWMGAETKQNAIAKLEAFNPKIGYPDTEVDFTGLEIGDDLVTNNRNLGRFFHAKDVAKEMQKTDRNEWGMTPQRVNAYYNPIFNEIVFPAAILQAPFFDPAADPAVNYGAIGAVIGHEMGHGFDDQGSKYDFTGKQHNWWTEADRAAFEAKTAMLIEQYSAYEPIADNFVNGKNSLGENIGDVGGLAMAYHAYQLSLNGQPAPVIDGLTGDQRFFLAWAQVWKEKRTEQSMLNQLRGGTHSPGRYRALAPRNHDAWYTAFDVQPGDALYLAPEERVRIW